MSELKYNAVVFCGPSGAGKGTCIEKMMKDHPDKFGFSISHTTRAIRGSEQNGVEYHFVKEEEMKAMIDKNMFLEHAYVHGHYYGTSKQAIHDINNQNKIAILDIDIQGSQQVRQHKDLKILYVFVLPPSIEELKKRLVARKTDSEDQIELRMKNALEELKHQDEFDEKLLNYDIETRDKEIERIAKILLN